MSVCVCNSTRRGGNGSKGDIQQTTHKYFNIYTHAHILYFIQPPVHTLRKGFLIFACPNVNVVAPGENKHFLIFIFFPPNAEA